MFTCALGVCARVRVHACVRARGVCVCTCARVLFIAAAYSSKRFLCFEVLMPVLNFNDNSTKMGADVGQLHGSQAGESPEKNTRAPHRGG